MQQLGDCQDLRLGKSCLFDIHPLLNDRVLAKVEDTLIVQLSMRNSINLVLFERDFDTFVRPDIEPELLVAALHNTRGNLSLFAALNISFGPDILDFGDRLPISVLGLHSVKGDSWNFLF